MLNITIGEISVQRIIEFEGPFFEPGRFFPDATSEAIAPHRGWLVPKAMDPETGMLIFPFQSYLVCTTHHTILIDTCVGCGKEIPHRPQWHMKTDRIWLEKLAATGLRPEEIDYIFCTHLHVDHCGWNTDFIDGKWVPTFPNATYVFGAEEYAAAKTENSTVFQQSVQPVMEAGKAKLVSSDFSLDDQVWLEPTPGHTAGHVAVHLSSGGKRAVMCGDLIHSPLQCVRPDWCAFVDLDKDLARQTRRNFMAKNSESGNLVLTAHFPSPSMGHFVAEGDTFRFDYLAD